MFISPTFWRFATSDGFISIRWQVDYPFFRCNRVNNPDFVILKKGEKFSFELVKISGLDFNEKVFTNCVNKKTIYINFLLIDILSKASFN